MPALEGAELGYRALLRVATAIQQAPEGLTVLHLP